jgi:hypothetical protein
MDASHPKSDRGHDDDEQPRRARRDDRQCCVPGTTFGLAIRAPWN